LNPTLNFKPDYIQSQLNLNSINNPSTFITGEVSFKISNILNPLSIQGKSGYILSILDNNNNMMQKSESLLIKPSINSDVTNLIISSSINTVSQITNLNFIFQTKNYISKDSIIEIIFPDDFQKLDNNLIKINGIAKLNMNGFLNFVLTGNKIKITNAFIQYYISTDIHNLRIANIRNPYSTKKTANFSFNIYDRTGTDLIYSLKNDVTITPSFGSFLQNTITPDIFELNKITKYSFNFITDSYIPKNSILIILFPQEVNIIADSDNSCKLSNFSGIITTLGNINVKCQVTLDNRAVINGLFQNDYYQVQNKFGFVIENIKNPNYSNVNFLFSISLNSIDGNVINLFSDNVALNISTGEISNLQLIQENKLVNQQNFITLDLNFQTEILDDSKIIIELPYDFRFLDDNINKVEFLIFIFDDVLNDFNLKNPINFTISASSINVNLNDIRYIFNLEFKKENLTIRANSKLKVQIKNIINPRCTKSIKIFNIYSYRLKFINNLSTYFQVDNLKIPIEFNNFEVKENSNISFLPKDSTTGKLTDYQFKVRPVSRISTNDYLYLILPSMIKITQNTNIIGNSANLNSKLDFSISNFINENMENFTQFKITLFLNGNNTNSNNNNINAQINYISENEEFLILVNNLINPYSTEPIQIPQIKIFTQENFLVENSLKLYYLAIFNPNILTNVIIKPMQSFIGGSSDYLIEFITSNPVFKDSQIKIFYPNQIIILDPKCSGLSGIFTDIICQDDPNSKILSIENGFPKDENSGLSIKIQIAMIKNNLKPPQIKTDTFKITIETKTGYLTDAIFSNVNLFFLCNSPCKSCLSDTITCLSCEGAQGQILLNGNCVTKCPSGYYYKYNLDPDKNQCIKCNDKCKSCSVSNPDICISCSEASPLFILETNSCVNKCPSGYFLDINNFQCVKCDSNCKTCVNNKNLCLSCGQGLSLFEKENRCVSNCPENITVLIKESEGISINNNDYNNTFNSTRCSSCDPSCQTCKDSISNCLSCANGYAFFGGKCIPEKDCPLGLISFEGKCVSCDEKCEVCKNSTDLNLCRKCKDGFILGEDSKCYSPISICEKGYFNDGGVCYKCDPNCDSCQGSANYCLSCHKNFLLQGRNCVQECREGYFKKNDFECGKCDSACKICLYKEDNCLECIKDMKLFITNSFSVCLNSCPDGYFNRVSKKLRRLKNLFYNRELETSSDKKLERLYKNINKIPNKKIMNSDKNSNNSILSNKYSKIELDKLVKINKNYLIKQLRILNSQSDSVFSSKSDCSPCPKNCGICSDSISCIKCDFGFYLYNKTKCLKFCPDNYYENSQNGLCVLDPNLNSILLTNGTYNKRRFESISASNLYGVINNNYICKNCDYSYFFLGIFIFGFFFIILLKCYHNEIHFFGCILGFSSIFIFSLNIYLMKIIFNFGIRSLFYLMIIKYFLNYFINYFFIMRLNFYIKSKDIQFSYWNSENRFILLIYILAGLILDYKITRLLYSRFKIFNLSSNKNSCIFRFFDGFFNAKFSDIEIINKPFKQMIIADIIFTDSLMFLISLFVFFNFFYSPEILKLIITSFSIHLILLFVKIAELIVSKADDEFYNQRNISTVIVKPYIPKDKASDNSENDNPKKPNFQGSDNDLNPNSINLLVKNQNLNKKDDELNRLPNYISERNESNNNHFRNVKTHNSVCFSNENLIGLNLNLENFKNKFNHNDNKEIVNKENLVNSNFYKYNLNNSGGVYEMEKYVNCNLISDFNLNNNLKRNKILNSKDNLEAESISPKKQSSLKNSSNDCYFSEYDRKCRSLFTKRNNDNNFNLYSNYENENYNVKNFEEENYYNNNNNNYFYDRRFITQKGLNFNKNNKDFCESNNFVNSIKKQNELSCQNSKYQDYYYESVNGRHILENQNNLDGENYNQENKEFSSENRVKEEIKSNTFIQSSDQNQKKIGFFKKIASSIKKIFPSSKKTQKIQYSVVQDQNQVSCFNNRKINTFKPGGIGLANKFNEISIEYKDHINENSKYHKTDGGIESTPNFNTNPSNNIEGNFCSNIWGYNDNRGNYTQTQNGNFSTSHRTNNSDLSGINLLKRKK